jgi:hypothetical protein
MESIILNYVMFFVGYALHMMLQVDAVVRAKNNAAISRFVVLKQNAVVILSRLFISAIVYWFMRNNPASLETLLGYIGITVSPAIGGAIGSSSWGVAGMFGYMVDSILTFIPFLKNYVPSLNGVPSPVQSPSPSQPPPKP